MLFRENIVQVCFVRKKNHKNLKSKTELKEYLTNHNKKGILYARQAGNFQ